MSKEFVVNQLQHHKNTFALGLAAAQLFDLPAARALLEGRTLEFGAFALDLTQIAASSVHIADYQASIAEFLKVQIRAVVREPFEHIKAYCRQSDQLPALRRADWYEFARIIRNCLSHDFRFTFTRDDRGKLPITWRGKHITADMEGRDLLLSSLASRMRGSSSWTCANS